jgi:hypothetical protein
MTDSRDSAAAAKSGRVPPWRLLAVGVLLVSLAGAAGFRLGQRALPGHLGAEPGEAASLEAELLAAHQEMRSLRGKLDLERTRHEISRRALEMVRSEIASQKEQIADLEEGLSFYKGLMAPGESAAGLSLRAMEIVGREEPGRFAYRILVQQEARKHSLLEGELHVEVFGSLLNQELSYSLAELSDDVDRDAIALRFRYFQAIEGELTLPEGFEPIGIRLVASVSKPQKTEVREQFNWEAQEKFTHVGK